ncbi:hypothetical protein [Rhizobium mulingense]|uniref:hypothetical protein n=1 Tax=Rhizobium mulingense TaxID=3031128 RepID=UPI002B484F0A|nr:hypothetical protein [Rhizobium sp. MJ21]MEB3046249.1 hypothetical protein [Rhizobium sp. MJ21]
MKSLTLTPSALFRLSRFSISSDWFDNFGLPTQAAGLKRVAVRDVIYIIEEDLEDENTPIIVVDLNRRSGIFNDTTNRSSDLERIITVARSIYSNSVVIPTGWRKHHEGSLFSIQGTSRDRNWRTRLHFDAHPRGSDDLFAFERTDQIVDFDRLNHDLAIYDEARTFIADAILTPKEDNFEETRAGITLSQRLPQGFVQGATLDQWYKSKLTADQRLFVDKPHDGPVRLRGAAGTGKTLSLVIKFLRDAANSEDRKEPIKLGFITHSFASVDLVGAIAESLDTTGLLHGSGKFAKLELRTLYDLAHKNLNFELDALEPLSLDGREGRRLQGELIEGVLLELQRSKIASLQFEDLTADLHGRWQACTDGRDKRLVGEIMNEFASVLDAEGIRASEEKGERYAKGATPRPAWLMSLPLEIDRRFILEVHRRYRRLLGDMNTLSVDQMIGDFNSFLDSNRWDRIRNREGYDAIFVDELHLFTSIERQTLHKLIRTNVEEDGKPRRPPIFMAYDMKQSPRDTFAQYTEPGHNLFGASTGLQNADLVKLEQVFRYTPQIAEFLADLDATFPAMDIPGDWDAYSGKAALDDGSVPELTVFKSDKDLFSNVFKEAEKLARSVDGGGRRVAVLCASAEQFDIYVRAASGQYKDRHIAITSREPSSELRHAGKRFILSMPEYVAGLQFETVFLIHVDAAEAPIDAGDGIRRRFISNIYLGSSRAEQTLKISAATTHGGKSDVLDMALARHSLREVAPPRESKPAQKKG